MLCNFFVSLIQDHSNIYVQIFSAGNVTSASLPTSGLSGTINFAEGLSSATAAGAALASLSTAMASAEQQLQMLQQKQQQLMKLQQQKQKLEQKLAESSSKIVSTGSAASTQPSSGFSSYSSSPYMYSSELLPPTPKTTPLFMTPPVTPPDEHQQNEHDPGKPPTGKATKVGIVCFLIMTCNKFLFYLVMLFMKCENSL